MNKLILLTAIISTLWLIYQTITPDWVKINKYDVKYCTISTNQNPDILCD